MIRFESEITRDGTITVVPTRNGLQIRFEDEDGKAFEWTITISLTDLLRYAALVKDVQGCPPGFEELITQPPPKG